MELEGIRFLVNDEGEKTDVVIDLRRYGDIWEDVYDAIVVESRRDEPTESLEEVCKKLGLNQS